LEKYGNRSLKKYQTLLISKKMKLKRYSKKIYRFLVIADIISVLFLFLYLCYLKKYMNDYMYYILSIYIPTIAIVAFLIFFICKVRRILSLFFILFNILIIYISIRNIIRVLYG